MQTARLGAFLAARRKWLVTVATFIAGAIDLGYVDGPARLRLGLVLLLLNSIGVHQVSNG